MTIEHDVVGRRGDLRPIRWTERDVLVYTVGIAARPALRVYPTFPVVAGAGQFIGFRRAMESIGDYDHAMVVHGTEALTLHAPIPLEGEALSQDEIVAIHDKGSGALVTVVNEVRLTDGTPLWTERVGVFIRGEGGWGGDRGNDEQVVLAPPADANGAADREASFAIPPDQALLYRHSGDWNPLHFDHSYATGAGFPSPILHGLCTYGIAGRLLLQQWCDDDTARLTHIEGRFASPVYPGETLTVRSWKRDADSAVFTVSVRDRVVFDRGLIRGQLL